jgi:hypothetical protein
MGASMSAGMLDSSSVSNWLPAPSAPRITIALRAEYGQAAATLGRESTYGERAKFVQGIIDLARRTPNVQTLALGHLVDWLSNLPAELPEPFIAIGDDGSISSEWDVGGNSLHVTFLDNIDEVYFVSPHGDEWESTLDAVDKISSAMRAIALAARR